MTTTMLRTQLRDLSTTLRGIADVQRELRQTQLAELRTVVTHGGTIGEAARAGGLSRAYLHRIGLHLESRTTDDPVARTRALDRARNLRNQLTEQDHCATDTRAARDGVIRALRTVMSTADIAIDAGITGERVRLILQSAAQV